MDKDDFDNDIYCFNETTDSEGNSSSSSAPYETNAFVLDLHKTTKENPNPENVKPPKKARKKKRKRSRASVSSESTSNSVTPTSAAVTMDEQAKEEFFDAHESYYDIPATQVLGPIGSGAIAEAITEQEQDQLESASVLVKKVPETTVLESPIVTENVVVVLKSSETTVLDTNPKEKLLSQEHTLETPKQTDIDSNAIDTKILDSLVSNTTAKDSDAKQTNETELDKVQENVPSQGGTLESLKQPSAITKPVTGPE